MSLAFPNWAGLACSVILIPGIMYANRSISETSPLYMLANVWITVFYRLPLKLIPSSGTTEEPKKVETEAKKS